jgi:hypothetical protein
MAITAEQKRVNDEYFLRMICITRFYIWKDKRHTYEIKDGKYHCPNMTAYRDFMKIVSPQFLATYVVRP